MTESVHLPVMPAEVLDLLAPKSGELICDLTLGAGGHAERVLDTSGPDGRVVGFDRDPTILETARERLRRFGDRVEVVVANHADAPRCLDERNIALVHGVLLDAGASSLQLDEAERGFSFQADGPLDMRMTPGAGATAADLLRETDAADLERIFREFGEEPHARAVARKVVEIRRRTSITRTREMAELVRSVIRRDGKRHPATRVFQALRIAVNGELDALASALDSMPDRLKSGGRMVVISFHSLEDRIVKTRFRERARESGFELSTPKPLRPTSEEVRRNPRSRSAKVRGLVRVGDSE